MKGKSTTDATFAVRQLQEKYREGQQDLHCVWIDLEKSLRQSPEGRAVSGHARQEGAREGHQTGECETVVIEVVRQEQANPLPWKLDPTN